MASESGMAAFESGMNKQAQVNEHGSVRFPPDVI
jgi:hypothetical protein